MLGILYRIYEKKLEKEVFGKNIPNHIAVVLEEVNPDELFDGLEMFIGWCRSSGIKELTFTIDGFPSPNLIEKFAERIDGSVRLIFDGREMEIENKSGINVNFVVNYGGRKEIVEAVKKIALSVMSGEIEPDEVDERVIEKHLKISSEPDVIIRASVKSFDFLIWQSIYSEHVFFDIDWKNLRYIDFLRILREYQKRERRYGR